MTVTSKVRREAALMLGLAALVFAPALMAGQGTPPGRSEGFPDLVGALKATPGCIGVETAMTQTGKRVIFAWFEDKKAVLNWYYSETHQAAMKQFFPTFSAHTPLTGVPDGVPVLAVASLTMAERAPSAATSLAISQIAIELYSPLPGGLALGGRFAPAALPVPGLRDVTMPK
jgi:hypothetical protein